MKNQAPDAGPRALIALRYSRARFCREQSLSKRRGRDPDRRGRRLSRQPAALKAGGGIEGGALKKRGDRIAVGGEVAAPVQGLVQPGAVREEEDQIGPQLLHPRDGEERRQTAGERLVQQRVVKAAQLFPAQRISPAQHPEERGIGRRAAPEHHALQRREFAAQRGQVLRGEKVPVVADRPGRVFHRKRKGLPIRRALIHALPVSRVDDQLRERIAAIDSQQGREFRRRGQPQARFDRHGNGRPGKDLVQKSVQRRGVSQHARSLVLAHHGARGAAGVEIHFGIAQFGQGLRRGKERRRAVRQDLRHERQALVFLRGKRAQMAALDRSASGKKRR